MKRNMVSALMAATLVMSGTTCAFAQEGHAGVGEQGMPEVQETEAEEVELSELYLEHVKLAEQASEESIVLLKNKAQTLPLASGSSVAVFGTGQAAYWKAGCDGSAAISGKMEVNLIDGIRNRGDALKLNETISSMYEENSEDFMYAPSDEAVIESAAEILLSA